MKTTLLVVLSELSFSMLFNLWYVLNYLFKNLYQFLIYLSISSGCIKISRNKLHFFRCLLHILNHSDFHLKDLETKTNTQKKYCFYKNKRFTNFTKHLVIFDTLCIYYGNFFALHFNYSETDKMFVCVLYYKLFWIK